ncbi:unnamed protein product [Prorocentrum cordatum]|uniref:Uncharacterized protein n=1 Tax=Prorocentrum cordatum TaxID=2364126 RepID=A0ABN9XL89_9DINO|nr:unnamed protein product [Polarella glacialis]
MAHDAAQKRLRLQSALHTGGTSLDGLARIAAKRVCEPAGDTKPRTINHELFERARFDVDLRLATGEPWRWEVCQPALVPQGMAAASGELQTRFSNAFSWRPRSIDRPWSMVIGLDERAATCTTFAAIRDHIIGKVEGKRPRLFAILLREIPLGPLSFRDAGAALNVLGQTRLLFATVKGVLRDLGGHRMTSDWTGASSRKPCTSRGNCWKKNSHLIPGCYDISCADFSKFRLRDHEGMAAHMAAVLAAKARRDAGAMGVGDFKELIQGAGFNPYPLGPLADEALRGILDISDIIRADWVHHYLQHGAFAWARTAYGRACESKLGMMFEMRGELVKAEWTFPLPMGAEISQVYDAFPASSEKESKIRCKAGGYISFYVSMRHFVECRLLDIPGLERENEPFSAACAVLDLALEAKRAPQTGLAAILNELRAALRMHMDRHAAAYGKRYLLPKHHATLHIPEQIWKDKFVVDMFVVERLNIRAEQSAENSVRNTERHQHSVL